MRVTFNAIQGSLDAINIAAQQFAKAQNQVATGKRISRPSDDPTSAERAVQDQSEIGTLDAYSQASDTASARLSVIDGALSSMTDILTNAQSTATQGHGDTADQVTRDTASTKILGLRDALAGVLNTNFRGTFVFSGSAAQTQPYSNATGAWVYSGDSTVVSADVGHNRSVALGLDGQAIAKGSDPADVLTVLDNLAAAVKAGDNPGITTAIDGLNSAFNRVVQAQSRVGGDEASIADGTTQLSTLRLAGTQRLSSDQDANLADAITQMSRAQTAYKAALGAVGQSNQTSLLDYLR
jgi:flagellar hook-associated protein 3 FlgL